MADGTIDIDVRLNTDTADSQADSIGKKLGNQIQQSVDTATQGVQKSTQQAMSEIGGTVESFGKSYSKAVTLPIAAAAVATGASAVEIDTALTGVRKTVDGTEEQYEQLKQAAIEFSKTNAVDPAQILDIQALGAQLGYSIEELDSFSETVSGLSISTNLSADEAATELAQFANIMGMAHDETKNYGSTIVELGNNFATTEADISHMAMRIAGAGKQIGLSEADVLGLSTALASMGINAEAGGTAISTIMANIDKEVSTNGKHLETWAQTANMSVDDFVAAWGSDAVGALSSVLVGMDAATEAGGNMSVMLDELGITSIRQTDTFKRLASNSEFLGKAVETANRAWEDNTALDKEVENRNNSMAAQLEILTNKIKAVAIEVGEPLMEALIGIIDTAQPLIDALASGAKAFGELDKGAQQAVLIAVGVVAAFGPVVTIVGKVTSGIANNAATWKRFSENLKTVKNNIITGNTALTAQSKAVAANATAVKASATASKAASVETKTLTTATKAQAVASTTATTSIKASTVAMNAAKVAGQGLRAIFMTMLPVVAITVAVEAITALAGYISDAQKKAEQFSKATDGITNSMDSYTEAFNNAKSSMDDVSGGADKVTASFGEIRDAADEAIAKTAELSDSINESFSEVGTNNAMVQTYAETIQRLTDNYDENGTKIALNTEQQGELINAVEGLNKIMGTSFSVVDAQNGVLNTNTDEILKSAEAWQKRALMEAQSAASADIMRRMVENTTALNKAEDTLRITKEKLAQAERNGVDDLTEYRLGVEQAQAEVDRLTGVQEGLEQEQKDLNESVARLTNELNSSVESLQAHIEGSEQWSNALQESEVNADDFIKKLSDIGVSTEDLSRIMAEQGEDGIQKLIDGYKNHGDELPAWIKNELGINLENASREASDRAGDGFLAGVNASQSRIINALEGVVGISKQEFAKIAEDAGISGTESISALALAFADGTVTTESKADEVKAAVEAKLNEMDGEQPAGAVIDQITSTFNARKGEVEGAGEGVADSAATGYQSQTGNASTWGEHLTRNFAGGISGGEAVSAVRSAVDTVMAATAAMHFSVPKSGVWSGAEKGGLTSGFHLVENFARGILQATPLTNSAIANMVNSAYNTVAKTETKNKKTVDRSAEDISKDVLSNANKLLSWQKKANDLTLSEELKFWNSLLGKVARGTEAYADIVANIYEIRRKQAEEAAKANEKIKQENESLLKAETDFVEAVKKINDQLAKDVKAAKDAYTNAVQSRTQAILSDFNLFQRYTTKAVISGEKLINNLQSQVNATKEYEAGLLELEKKIGMGDLYQEIADMGMDGLRYIKSLNQMTDAQIQQFVKLYKERNAVAQREATHENADLLAETNATIKKLNQQATVDVKDAANELKKSASDLSTSAAKSVANMAASIKVSADNITASINNAINSINRLSKTSFGRIETGIVSSNPVVPYSMDEGISLMSYNGRAAVIDERGAIEGYTLRQSDYQSMAYRQSEASLIKGMTALTMAVKDNRMSAGNTTNNQTLNFNAPVESPDQIAREMRMQQMYGLAGKWA